MAISPASIYKQACHKMVASTGLEPARAFNAHSLLRAACLPIPPRGQKIGGERGLLPLPLEMRQNVYRTVSPSVHSLLYRTSTADNVFIAHE